MSSSEHTSGGQDRTLAPEFPTDDLLLRPNVVPVTALDVDDRHLHRATSSKERQDLYTTWYEQQRRQHWHYFAMGLVALVVIMVLFLAGTVALVRLVPEITLREAATIAGWGLLAGSGGLTIGSLVTSLVGRRRQRWFGGGKPPP